MDWTTKEIPTQSGRLALITGANSGIGFHAALELARNGAEVLLPARTMEKSLDAIQRIKTDVPHAKLVSGVLDLASLASIHAFAGDYEDRFPGQSLDLLINNAGVLGFPKRELTVDGFERQFATNYLGPFVLTALLFKRLKPQPGTRIVTISSAIAHQGKIAFDNLQSEREYKPLTGTYAQSKLADLIFVIDLQRRLNAAASPISSVGAHPGFAITNISTNMSGAQRTLGSLFGRLIGQAAPQGALCTLFAATSPNVKPGGYYGPNGFKELRGYPAPAAIPVAATDQAVATRLWAETERMTGVPFDLSLGIDKEAAASMGK